MSKRLQVILEDREMKEIRTIARRKRMTVAEWVRGALRAAKSEEPAADPRRKLEVLRAATAHSFPTAEIEEMLAQIERGYADEPA
ncbi:MAG: antitoxin [Acidobacteriota bacterium]